MKYLKLLAAIALTTATLQLNAQAKPDLQTLIAQLDAASKSFKNAQANMQYDNYTRVVGAHDFQTGSIYIERSSGGNEMGAIIYDLGPDGQPAKKPNKIIRYDSATLQVYSPGMSEPTVDVFKAGANQAKYESFLTLGFGGSGTALASAWTITDQGSETIDGVKTEKLDLVSKDPSVKSTFTHVTIWIDPTRDVSPKQIFFAPNGDTRTALYTNIRLKASINKKPYTISSKATRVPH